MKGENNMSFSTKKGAVKFGAAIAAIALLGAFALTSCGSQQEASDASADTAEKTTIVIAATPTPHAEILNDVVAPALAEQGYELEVLIEDDYSLPNKQVAEGEADANYFQHKPFLDSEIEQFGYELDALVSVHYEPLGVYPGTKSDLAELADGDKIAIPNDTTNEARALLLLEQEGLITLDPEAGLTATPRDIVDNPHNIDFVETDAELITHILEDVAYGVINGNYALNAGLNPYEDALAVEAADGEAGSTYANFVAIRSADADAEWVKALEESITSDEVRDYINETYNGAVLPVF